MEKAAEKVTEKVTDILIPHERKEDDDKLYGKDAAAGPETLQPSAYAPPLKSPLAQGHLQPESSEEDQKANISAPAGLTSMTGQYVSRKPSNVSEAELKKHGTAVGLASATMASGATGEQNPHNPNSPPS